MKTSVWRALLPIVVGTLVAAGAGAQAQGRRAAARNPKLRPAAQLEALFGRVFSQLAARYRRSVPGLRALVARDGDLWVDEQARLVYLCESGPLPVAAGNGAPAGGVLGAPPFPLEDTFQLHSRPSATRKVYLDFDGHVTSGTWWNEEFTGNSAFTSAPFSTDGDPNSFSAAELEAIQQAWQRVAEDFAPFNVDVTTEDPGVDGLRRTSGSDSAFGVRVVISPTTSWYPDVGGVAYVGVFDMTNTGADLPCFVFSSNLSNSERYIAEASSHEVGHTLGLSHDGRSGGTQYYQGHGSWAPIMGASYYRDVTQWSKGEYSGANNTEDDFAIMQANGGILIDDDHASAIAGATVLTGTSPSASGVIEQRTDQDFFRFTTGAGSITLRLAVAARGPDVDGRLDLYNSAGSLIASSNPAGLPATLTQTVAAGTYYVSVDGVGAGDAASTGYSDYASTGAYTLSASLVAGGNGSLTLTSPNGGENWSAGSARTVTWTSSGVTGNVRLDYSTNGGSTWTSITSSTANDGSEAWTVPNVATTQARVRVSTPDGSVQDLSNANFTISVVGGDAYEADNTAGAARPIFAGATQTHSIHTAGDEDWVSFSLSTRSYVTLATDGASGDTVLELYGPNSAGTLVQQDDDSGSGAFSLIQRTGSSALAAGTYYARVREKSGAGTLAGYTLSLSVTPGATVTVSSPNGGESWTAGSTRNIAWNSSNLSGSVKLEYFNGSSWVTISAGTSNDGFEAWVVPDVATSQARVRVTAVSDPGAQDQSDGAFSIVSPLSPTVTVTSPNGGESWSGGSTRTITWTSSGVSGPVRIEYSLNNGGTWTVVANSIANDGSENWVVPSSPTTQARIRVSMTDGSAQDVSNAAFTITGAAGDSYEEDDSIATAKTLNSGEKQNRTIHAAGNADWVKIVLPRRRRVTIATSGPKGGDTVLQLYRSNGTQQIVGNDNISRANRYSRIAGRVLKAGTYYVKVTAKGSSVLSSYTLAMVAR